MLRGIAERLEDPVLSQDRFDGFSLTVAPGAVYKKRMSLRTLLVLPLLLALAPVVSAAGTPPAVKCQVAKVKAAGAKATAKLACHAKAIGKGVAVDSECLAKAEARFLAAFAKAEAPGACPTSGDATAVEALVDGFVGDVLGAVGPSTTTTITTTTSTTTTLAGCASSYADCTEYLDLTDALATRTISFGPNFYSPKCIRIRAGQTVTFAGEFSSHPLRRASCSPTGIADASSGTSRAFTLSTLGVHGYHCNLHGTDAGLGMAGAIQVVP